MEPPTVPHLLFVSWYIFIRESSSANVFSVLDRIAILLHFLILSLKRKATTSLAFLSCSLRLLWIHSCPDLNQDLLTSLVFILSASSNAMTQQLQDEFDSSVENAEAWMKAIQERLRINDNTKGPRSALEARLRETEVREKWCTSSEVTVTAAVVNRSCCCELWSFLLGSYQLPLLAGILVLCGWVYISIHSYFSICRLFTDVVEKEDGNFMSQASKLFRLIWKTSNRFGRLKCLHFPMSMVKPETIGSLLEITR